MLVRFLIAFIDPLKSHALIGFTFCGWTICERSARCREHAGSEIASTTSSIEDDREMGITAECLYTAFRGRSTEAMRWGRVEASMGGKVVVFSRKDPREIYFWTPLKLEHRARERHKWKGGGTLGHSTINQRATPRHRTIISSVLNAGSREPRGAQAARRGPVRAQRPPGRAHGVYCRHVVMLVVLRSPPSDAGPSNFYFLFSVWG